MARALESSTFSWGTGITDLSSDTLLDFSIAADASGGSAVASGFAVTTSFGIASAVAIYTISNGEKLKLKKEFSTHKQGIDSL